MQNQHFGDLNTYQKLGLLRCLANAGQCKIGVCWMLTEAEGSAAGKFDHYLNQPELWEAFDPALFAWLRQCVKADQEWEVTLAQSAHILPTAKFYGALLTNFLPQRGAYFKRMRTWFAPCDLIFYDPDNGIETPSCSKGRQHSAKYLYWDELLETFAAGHSVLVAQHFRREDRAIFIQQMVKEYQNRLQACQVYWFRTHHLIYFLSVQAQHREHLAARVRAVGEQWHLMQVGGLPQAT